ncbi:DoxX family protein [Janibacter sp. GS2]|uniref:DoxX family protein n=1 Tax=Janibacter sp. GS2 TaxID=3442646 RepID=UPI003EC020C8
MRRSQQIDTALLIIRVVTGVTMIMHGWQKLTGPGFGGVGDVFVGMDVPLAAVAGPLTLVVELVGGVLLVLGLGTRVVGALFALVMLGALFIVHLPAGFFAADGGYELVLLLAAVGAALAVSGGGAWSADAVIAGRQGAATAERREGAHAAV